MKYDLFITKFRQVYVKKHDNGVIHINYNSLQITNLLLISNYSNN